MSEPTLQFSPTIDKIAKAFVLAQGNMDAVRKDHTNPAFKSKYADLASVVAAVAPALQSQGIGLIQAPCSNGETITVETVLLHESGEWMRSSLTMRPTKTDPQGAGSAITYARRFALLAMCGVAPEDDDGAAASAKNDPPRAAATTPQNGSGARETRPTDTQPVQPAQTASEPRGTLAIVGPAPLDPGVVAKLEPLLAELHLSDEAVMELVAATALRHDFSTYEWRNLATQDIAREFFAAARKRAKELAAA